MAEIKKIIEDMKENFPVIAAGFITRDGMPKYLEVPEGSYPETFSIMCATVLGAAGTAATELGQPNPEYVVVETGGMKIFIVSGGMKGILVSAINTENKEEEIIKYMKSVIETL